MPTLRQLLPDLGRFWTIPNALSLCRVLLVAPIAVLIWHNTRMDVVLGLVLVGIVTDFLDGRIARATGVISEWGKVLDPLADKVAAIVLVAVLALRPHEPRLPLWLLAMVASRDILIVWGGVALMRKRGELAMSLQAGKWAVTLLSFLIVAYVIDAPTWVAAPLLWGTAGLLVFSSGMYLLHFISRYR